MQLVLTALVRCLGCDTHGHSACGQAEYGQDKVIFTCSAKGGRSLFLQYLVLLVQSYL